ncbi:hypothetical protein MWU75_07515 [Ornithinimicrobium sp. F0845]|uniref:hypothetical protein n=1 Tax=Ornithinimicrobium sp. F0845 TaxID=2926412 RepID=UPI001FF4F38C|nr:hypothetical protein [Ornithinimicrobium sp. F0845]MCK0111981.1 hypothetical protein [Ornithinimicrobium sp. F0845]
MKKVWFIIGASIGYILGARAGRERYDQISRTAEKAWNSDMVQTRVDDVKSVAAEAPGKVAGTLAGSAKDLAGQAKAKVTGHETTDRHGDYENATGSWDAKTGTASVDDSGFGPGGDKLP